jgi:hypothetical protein
MYRNDVLHKVGAVVEYYGPDDPKIQPYELDPLQWEVKPSCPINGSCTPIDIYHCLECDHGIFIGQKVARVIAENAEAHGLFEYPPNWFHWECACWFVQQLEYMGPTSTVHTENSYW